MKMAVKQGSKMPLKQPTKKAYMTKVVIRRLPPTMTKEQFLEQIAPVPEVNYFCFAKADTSLRQHAFTRAYLNFVNHEDIFLFKDKFDGYVFLDSKGNEYPAVVEFAPCQTLPRKRSTRRDPKCGTILTDPNFLQFLESMGTPDNVTLPTVEANLEEIKARDREIKANHGCLKVTTPLLEFVQQRNIEKQNAIEDKKKKELEKKEEMKKRELERKEAMRKKELERREQMKKKELERREEIKKRELERKEMKKRELERKEEMKKRELERKEEMKKKELKRKELERKEETRKRELEIKADMKKKDLERKGILEETVQQWKAEKEHKMQTSVFESWASFSETSSNDLKPAPVIQILKNPDRASAKEEKAKGTNINNKKQQAANSYEPNFNKTGARCKQRVQNKFFEDQSHKKRDDYKCFGKSRQVRRIYFNRSSTTPFSKTNEKEENKRSKISESCLAMKSKDTSCPEEEVVASSVTKRGNKELPTDPRAQRKIKNRDRPARALYQPGMRTFRERVNSPQRVVSTSSKSSAPSASPANATELQSTKTSSANQNVGNN